MTLQVQITEIANLFHFISNLTHWHFSVRPMYKDKWLEETGSLSFAEEQILNEIEGVFQKYSFGPHYWGRIFLTTPESRIWKVAEKKIDPKDLKLFRLAARTFNPRFQKVWQKEKYLLKYWSLLFEEDKNKYFNQNLIKDLNTLFSHKTNIESIKIILLIATEYSSNGGANLGPGIVTLEIGINGPKVIEYAMMVLWHELIHGFWMKMSKDNFINEMVTKFKISHQLPEFLFNNRPLENVINEAVVESLFPKGYLASKYFDFDAESYYSQELARYTGQKEKDMGYWRAYSGFHLMPLSKKYIESGRSIDEDYIREVVKSLKTFL